MTPLSNNQLKFIRSLHQAKYRKEHRLFIAEGPKLVEELRSSSFPIKLLLGTEKWFLDHPGEVSAGTESIKITPKELERISTLKTPNEVLAVVEIQDPDPETMNPEKDLILVLNGIRDPGNLGTILRTADWFGYRNVICSPDCVELYNPKVVQATMGSITRVRVFYRDLVSLFKKQSGIPVYGALLDGENIYSRDLESKGYLVIGNESRGISSELIPFITHPVSIPSVNALDETKAESLNASIATAILCSEFRRQSYSR
jgi:TrmH family RNA methyltransferase